MLAGTASAGLGGRGVFLPLDKLATCVICCRQSGRQGLYEHPKLSRAVFNEARPLLAPRFSTLGRPGRGLYGCVPIMEMPAAFAHWSIM
jgi:hypothetical protein